ncbi:MAG: hypothetical protein HZC01_04535 [Candidatus Kerfeldbacteria bacterium]|nr:hypothetical protein [Candidatus Kerfeldbacteria bacterium]
MNEISRKIIEVIKAEHIQPKPRWQFLVQRWIVWVASVFAVTVGSVAFSVILFRLVNNDWEIIESLPRSPLEHLVNTMPYIWLIVLIIFIGIAYYNVRHTHGSYKYHAYFIVIGSMGLSLIFGGVLYGCGLGPRVDAFVNQHIPFMQHMADDRYEIWVQPEQGRLAGEITGMLSGVGMFEIVSLDGEEWIIRPTTQYLAPPQYDPQTGDYIRIVGYTIDHDARIFGAQRIMPLFFGPGINGGQLPVRGMEYHIRVMPQ